MKRLYLFKSDMISPSEIVRKNQNSKRYLEYGIMFSGGVLVGVGMTLLISKLVGAF